MISLLRSLDMLSGGRHGKPVAASFSLPCATPTFSSRILHLSQYPNGHTAREPNYMYSLFLFMCVVFFGVPGQAGEIRHIERVSKGAEIYVCSDDNSNVDEFLVPLLSQSLDIAAAKSSIEERGARLIIMSHRNAVVKNGCDSTTLEELAEVYAEYRRLSFHREVIARRVPEYAEALRAATCQPLAGFDISSGKRVSIVLFERNSETIGEALDCARNMISYFRVEEGL